MASSCIFCKIVEGTIPCIKITETANVIAFMDIFPTSKGHCLVVPKVHAEKLHDVSDEVMAEVGVTLRRVAKAVAATDYNILQNNGALAHQAVNHVHFHIIPKTTEEDGLGVSWPATKGETEVLEELAQGIRERLSAL